MLDRRIAHGDIVAYMRIKRNAIRQLEPQGIVHSHDLEMPLIARADERPPTESVDHRIGLPTRRNCAFAGPRFGEARFSRNLLPFHAPNTQADLNQRFTARAHASLADLYSTVAH
jgi:hypothetical protein